jgi:hypothetical protein
LRESGKLSIFECGDDGYVHIDYVRVLQRCGSACPVTLETICSLIHPTAGDVVDLYNSTSGVWSTAQLSVARSSPAATSVGNVALIAGGMIFSIGACCGLVCNTNRRSLMRTAVGSGSNAVDLYNNSTRAWSTAQLSLPRGYLTATSVGNVALFAGGCTGGALLL